VYAAHDPKLDRTVAVKLIATPDGERTLQQARAMGQLSHPNVAAVYDAGLHDGQVFVVMELVEGTTLRSWLGERARSRREVLHAFAHAGRGLEAAHAAGIVDGNFQAHNVLIGGDGRICVTDLGLTVRESADARSDQVAFCAALQQALEHDRSRTPTWLRRVLARGRGAAPYDSMSSLLAALAKTPRARRTWLAVIGAAAIVLAVAIERRQHAVTACELDAHDIFVAWNPPQQLATHAALLATRAPFAEDAWRSTSRELDTYSSRWSELRLAACRSSDDDPLHALRTQCLEDHRHAFVTLASLLASADAKTIERATAAAYELPPLTTCADDRELASSGEARSNWWEAVEAARVEPALAEANAMASVGRFEAAEQRIAALSPELRALGLKRLAAETDFERGQIQMSAHHDRAATDTFYAVVAAGDAAGADVLVARARIELVYLVGYRQHAHDEARTLAAQAKATLERLGGNQLLESERSSHIGTVNADAGEYALALEDTRRACEIAAHVLGDQHPKLATCLSYEGNELVALGRYADGIALYQRALAMLEHTFGRDHPRTASALNNLGAVLLDQGRYDDARNALVRALATYEKLYGADSIELVDTLTNLGEVAHDQHHEPEAVAYDRRALAIVEHQTGPASLEAGESLESLAIILVSQDRAEALADLARAGTIYEHVLGADHPRVAAVLGAIGAMELAEHRYAAAISSCTRALAIHEAHPSDNALRADARFTLAQALVATHADPHRAYVLATGARDDYGTAGPRYTSEIANVEAWLKAHAP
jgi:tetratricopeptide (TPR) repeat protein/tRNA A-37 threonylcarbamoyl transferase component Bud32